MENLKSKAQAVAAMFVTISLGAMSLAHAFGAPEAGASCSICIP